MLIPQLAKRAIYFFYRIRELESRVAQVESSLRNIIADYSEPASLSLATDHLAGSWKRVGFWPGYKRARAMVSYGGALHVGLDGDIEGRAAAYALGDDGWRLVGGIDTGFTHGTEVASMCVHAGLLYCGISSVREGAQLWRTDGSKFERVGHWPEYRTVISLASHGGSLFASLAHRDKRDCTSPVLAFDGQNWTTIARSFGRYACAYYLHVHQGTLYAAMLSYGWPGGHVWRLTGTIELLGGDGRHQSWSYLSAGLRLCSAGSHLVVLLNRDQSIRGDLYNAWAFDGETWAPLPQFPNRFLSLYSYNALAFYRERLIVGAGGRPAGRATVMSLSALGWKQIGGSGVNQSWSRPWFRRQNAPLVRASATEYVYRFAQHKGCLFAGFGASPGCGQVWQFTPMDLD